MEHEPSSLDSSLDSRLKPRLNQSALAPMHVSNLDHLFLCARAIMILETSTSSPSFRFSEAKSAHLESSPLSSAASKGTIHEKIMAVLLMGFICLVGTWSWAGLASEDSDARLQSSLGVLQA